MLILSLCVLLSDRLPCISFYCSFNFILSTFVSSLRQSDEWTSLRFWWLVDWVDYLHQHHSLSIWLLSKVQIRTWLLLKFFFIFFSTWVAVYYIGLYPHVIWKMMISKGQSFLCLMRLNATLFWTECYSFIWEIDWKLAALLEFDSVENKHRNLITYTTAALNQIMETNLKFVKSSRNTTKWYEIEIMTWTHKKIWATDDETNIYLQLKNMQSFIMRVSESLTHPVGSVIV